MKYKIIVCALTLIIIFGGVIRFSCINKEMQIYASVEKKYNIGDEVPFENDIFFYGDERANGYSITVLDTSYISIDEFKDKYHISLDDTLLEFSDYVYMVRANFKNSNGNDDGRTGVNVNQLILQETSFITYPDKTAFMLLNDFDYLTFSLSPKKEREFIIPFGINKDYININNLINGDTRLVVTLYPNKKTICLN